MKKIISTSIILVALFTACGPSHVVVQSAPPPPPPPQPAPEVTYQSFYDELSPYGHWIDYPGYGYVWMPAVAPGFRPYATNGHWVYTNMGWTWASDYQWGWAAFHYGRWFFDGAYGWMWVPGNEWAPAWVSWRTSPDYYGWAPLGPNISYNAPVYNPPTNYWCFVPHQYVASPHVNNYYVNESRNVTIINNTTIINNVTVNNTRVNNTTNNTVVNNNVRNVFRGGPDPREVERSGGEQIRTVEVRENNRPGEQVNTNEFAIYRPRVNASPGQGSSVNNEQRIKPSKVESLHDFRPNSSNVTVPAQGNNSMQGNRNNGFNPTEPNDPRRENPVRENPSQGTGQDTRDNFNNQGNDERRLQQGQNGEGNGHQNNQDDHRNSQSVPNGQANGHQNNNQDDHHNNFQNSMNGQGNGQGNAHQNNSNDQRNFQSVPNGQANGHQNNINQDDHRNNFQSVQNGQGNGHQNNQNNRNSNPQLQNQQQKTNGSSNGGNAKPKTFPKPQDKNGKSDEKHKDNDK